MLEVNGEGIQFKNQNRSIRVPFVIYAEFESLTNLIDTCEQSSERSFTNKYQKNKPCGFCHHIVCSDDKPCSLKSQSSITQTTKIKMLLRSLLK